MKKLIRFTAICFAISLVFAGIFKLAGGDYKSVFGTLFASAYMLIPMISVIICQLISKEKVFKACNISFRINKWWVLAWLAMPVFNALAMFASGLVPGVDITTESPVLMTLIAQMPSFGPWGILFYTIGLGLIAGLTINALFAFCEEVAWRGYLLEALKEMGFWKKALIIGFIWGLWHAPVILMGHNYPEHPIAGVFMMILFCMALAPVCQLFAERSKSVIAAAISHGTMNATAGLATVYLTANNDLLCGTCGLCGIIILILADCLIALSYTKKGKVSIN